MNILDFRPTRRHRMFTLALALIAGGVFFVFVARVSLQGAPEEPLRTCGFSNIYKDGNTLINFNEMRRRYHFTMEQLVEERMRLYEGRTLLRCSDKEMSGVIPPGTFASQVAQSLPHVPDPPQFSYADFDPLIYEFWRTYDCHLFALESNPLVLASISDNRSTGDSFFMFPMETVYAEALQIERVKTKRTFDRLLFVLRSSEQYLPLHASLRCLQRGSSDVRNAFALISDASQCLPARLAEPSTSIIK